MTKAAGEGEGPPNTINANYFLGIDASSGVLVADYEEPTGPNHPVSGTTVVTSNVWHHAAVTYDASNGTWKLYLDGVLDRTLVLASAFQPNASSLQHAALGSSLTTTGTASGFFNGALDEARIWNIARSDAQIAANFDNTLTSGAGLLARYGLDEGTGTTTASSVAGAPNGTLTGAAPAPAWTAGPPLTPAGNGAPVFSTDITDQTDAEGEAVSLDADATDPDLDTLTYSATGLPGGVTINPSTGVISGTLAGDAADNSPYSVVITVSDGSLTDTDSFSWTVTNTNQAPVFTTDITDQTDAEGDIVSLDADATDPDLDTVTYSASPLPDGVTINPTTGVISGTLSLASAGTYNVTVTASDGSLPDFDTFTWTVTNTNQAPVFSTDITDQSDAEGDSVSLDADATDADAGTTLVYSATGLPGGVSINSSTGVISGTLSSSSAGTHNVVVTVSDGALTDTDSFTWTVTEPVTGSALDFDGVDDHVTFGSASGLNSNTFTIETWFRRDGTGTPATTSGSGGVTAIPLVTKGLSESGQLLNWFLGIDSATGRLAADFESASDDSNHPLIGTTTITNGTWNHAAITYDGVTFRLFLNGIQEASVAIANGPGTASGHHAALATAMTSTGAATGRFDGALDEIRIWNTARSAAQLGARRDQELLAGTGLLARYGLAEATGTAINNSVAGGVNGTAVGGPAWVGGAPISAPANAAPVFSTDLANQSHTEGNVISLDADASDADLDTLVYSATNLPGGISINSSTGVISGTLNGTSSGSYNVIITVSDGVDTDTDLFTWTVAEPVAPNMALDFDGTNDHVTFGAAPNLGVQSFTIETWFRRDGAGSIASTGTGGVTNAIPLVSKGRSQADTPANLNANYFLGIDATTGTLVADFEDTATGGNHPVTGITAIPISATTWHHAAVTYDTATDTWNLYLNGNLERTLAIGNFTPESASIQHAALATAIDSTGTLAGFFNGVLDEVRIWNVARSQAQIQASKDLELTSGTGLIARYGLTEGTGTTVNNTAASAPANTNGTAVGGPPWVSGFVPPVADTTPPPVPSGLAAAPGTNLVSLTWNAVSAPDLAGYRVFRGTSLPVDTTGNGLGGAALHHRHQLHRPDRRQRHRLPVRGHRRRHEHKPLRGLIRGERHAICCRWRGSRSRRHQRLHHLRHGIPFAQRDQLHARDLVPARWRGRRRDHRHRWHRERPAARDQGRRRGRGPAEHD